MGAINPEDRFHRQIQMMSYVAQGWSQEEIGREMYFSPSGVKWWLDILRHEIGARNIAHAVAICIERGYLAVDADGAHVAHDDPTDALSRHAEFATAC